MSGRPRASQRILNAIDLGPAEKKAILGREAVVDRLELETGLRGLPQQSGFYNNANEALLQGSERGGSPSDTIAGFIKEMNGRGGAIPSRLMGQIRREMNLENPNAKVSRDELMKGIDKHSPVVEGKTRVELVDPRARDDWDWVSPRGRQAGREVGYDSYKTLTINPDYDSHLYTENVVGYGPGRDSGGRLGNPPRFIDQHFDEHSNLAGWYRTDDLFKDADNAKSRAGRPPSYDVRLHEIQPQSAEQRHKLGEVNQGKIEELTRGVRNARTEVADLVDQAAAMVPRNTKASGYDRWHQINSELSRRMDAGDQEAAAMMRRIMDAYNRQNHLEASLRAAAKGVPWTPHNESVADGTRFLLRDALLEGSSFGAAPGRYQLPGGIVVPSGHSVADVMGEGLNEVRGLRFSPERGSLFFTTDPAYRPEMWRLANTQTSVGPDGLHEYIGSAAAKDLMAQPLKAYPGDRAGALGLNPPVQAHELRYPDGMSLSPEGFTSYYGDGRGNPGMVGNILQRELKRLGQDVNPTPLQLDYSALGHATRYPIDDATWEKIRREGLPLFNAGGVVSTGAAGAAAAGAFSPRGGDE